MDSEDIDKKIPVVKENNPAFDSISKFANAAKAPSEAMNRLAEVAKSQTEALGKVAEMTHVNTNIITDILAKTNIDAITNVAKSNFEAMQSASQLAQTIAESVSKSISPLMNMFASIDRGGFEKFNEEFGWLEAISMAYASELQKELKINGKNAVWDRLIKDFSDVDFLKSIKDDIVKYELLKNRTDVVIRAIEHHQNKDYISSIPLFLSQIEGILWDMGIKEKLIENNPNSNYMIDIKGNIIRDKSGKAIECGLGELLMKLYGKDSKLSDHTKNEIFSKNLRHPVLHGRKTDYNTVVNSTMLVLLLYMLIEKISEYPK